MLMPVSSHAISFHFVWFFEFEYDKNSFNLNLLFPFYAFKIFTFLDYQNEKGLEKLIKT